MTYQNKRANREVMRVVTTFCICLLFTALHTYYMDGLLYKARVQNDRNFQEFVKVLKEKDQKIDRLEQDMKGMIKKPVVKKKILSRTCK